MRITGSPDALFAPTTPGAFGGLGLTAGDLPGDWASYTADQKIAYFNENAITADELKAAGVAQSDLDWMAQHGYTGQPESLPAAEDVQQTAQVSQVAAQATPVMVGDVALPADWSGYDPYQKIEFFNAHNIGPSTLLAVGVSRDDLEWMTANGYTGQAAPTAVQTITQTTTAAQQTTAKPAVTLPAAATQTTTEQTLSNVFSLPDGWDKLSASQKISYLNQNSIGEPALVQAGASAADLAWMKQHGYTGKPAAALTITKAAPAAAGGAVPLVLAVAAAYFLGA